MLESMDVKKFAEKVEAHTTARGTVHGERHVEALGGLVDRIEISVTVALMQ